MSGLDPTVRFSDRVSEYVRYRPTYPTSVARLLETEYGLAPGSARIADVGSGTGILSRLFLERGHRVVGVEPNREMAKAAETGLAEFESFENRHGRAEETGLPAASVDLVVVGQAFHWFDVAACRTELRRILVPGGAAALIWNLRRRDVPFMAAYERFLRRWGREYGRIARRYARPEELRRFFEPLGYREETFTNVQVLDFEGLHGRLVSASYMPRHGDPEHSAMRLALRSFFDRFAEDGEVGLQYTTEIYHGRLSAG